MWFLQDRHQMEKVVGWKVTEGIKHVLRITSSDGFVHHATEI
jgi:hypothetical protein